MTTPAKTSQRHTYSDYCAWSDDQRWELIAGVAYAMVPAPTPRHQAVQLNLAGLLLKYFRGKPCKPFIAPIDLKLSEFDLIQPDLLVVCNPDKIHEKAIVGPPDLVIEILSPSTETRDRREKKALYETYQVPEYWLVSINGFVEQYVLNETKQYGSAVITGTGESLTSVRFPEFVIAVSEIFEGITQE